MHGPIGFLFISVQAIEVDKEVDDLTGEETCTLTSITFSSHRLIPYKKFSLRKPDGTTHGVLHPPIILEHGLETIFADPETSTLITDILRGYAMVIHEADMDNEGARHQPIEDDPDRNECIDTKLDESFQIASYQDVALEIMNLKTCGDKDRNCIVEGVRQLVKSYEQWFRERQFHPQDAYMTIAKHIAYVLQQPPAFRWYFHPSRAMVVKGRIVLFYRLDELEGLPPSDEDPDRLLFEPLPGDVDDHDYEACDRAISELNIIVNKFVVEPESKRIEVVIGEVGDGFDEDPEQEDEEGGEQD